MLNYRVLPWDCSKMFFFYLLLESTICTPSVTCVPNYVYTYTYVFVCIASAPFHKQLLKWMSPLPNVTVVFLPVPAKNRGIAIPVDLVSQVDTLFSTSQIVKKHTRHWINAGKSRRDSTLAMNRDYRSIIEGLQVCIHVYLFTCWSKHND